MCLLLGVNTKVELQMYLLAQGVINVTSGLVNLPPSWHAAEGHQLICWVGVVLQEGREMHRFKTQSLDTQTLTGAFPFNNFKWVSEFYP